MKKEINYSWFMEVNSDSDSTPLDMEMAGCESRMQVIALLVSLLIIPVQVQIVFSDQNFGKLPIAELGFSPPRGVNVRKTRDKIWNSLGPGPRTRWDLG